jgi:hypothetical protein
LKAGYTVLVVNADNKMGPRFCYVIYIICSDGNMSASGMPPDRGKL